MYFASLHLVIFMSIGRVKKDILILTDALHSKEHDRSDLSLEIEKLNDTLIYTKNLLWIKNGINLGVKENFLEAIAQYSKLKNNAISTANNVSVDVNIDFSGFHNIFSSIDISDKDMKYDRGEEFLTYAQAVDPLRSIPVSKDYAMPVFMKDDGSLIYRPFTMKELYERKLEDFFTLKDADDNERSIDDRLRFWNTWIHTCSGIALLDEKTIKIIPESMDLIMLDKNFSDETLPINALKYVNNAIEFKYEEELFNKGLKNPENAPAFRALFGDNNYGRSIIRESNDIIKKHLNTSGMGFYLNNSIHGLRALCSNDRHDIEDDDLDNGSCFLASSAGRKPYP